MSHSVDSEKLGLCKDKEEDKPVARYDQSCCFHVASLRRQPPLPSLRQLSSQLRNPPSTRTVAKWAAGRAQAMSRWM
jgi:hypothetical protein